MTHNAKLDVYILLAIVLGVILFLMGDYWIAGPVLLVLFLCAYPQSYETSAEGLVIHTALGRRRIPYRAIRFVGPTGEEAGWLAAGANRIRIAYGAAAEVLIAPADRDAFLRDVARRAPHLVRRGPKLMDSFA
jgi:hypothetical protein